MIISKELLSDVLEEKVVRVHIMENMTYIYFLDSNQEYFMNIHELANKCKEWASIKGFRLTSFQDLEDGCCEVSESISYPPCLFSQICKTEAEAIFEACQWILDNG